MHCHWLLCLFKSLNPFSIFPSLFLLIIHQVFLHEGFHSLCFADGILGVILNMLHCPLYFLKTGI